MRGSLYSYSYSDIKLDGKPFADSRWILERENLSSMLYCVCRYLEIENEMHVDGTKKRVTPLISSRNYRIKRCVVSS